jgi:PhnB protein
MIFYFRNHSANKSSSLAFPRIVTGARADLWLRHRAMNNDFSHIPAGYHSVTPSLTAKDAKAALAFYTAAFGAEVQFIMDDPKSGGVAHAEFRIGNSTLMVSDEYPSYGAFQPEIGKGASFMIYVKDVEAAFQQAFAAGAAVTMPPTDMFWGDRVAKFNDPHGYRWTVAQKVREVSPEEMNEAMKNWEG